MSIVVENIKDFFTKRIATEDYVQKEIAKLRKELVDYLKETGIKASIEDLEEQAREHKITLKELYEIIKPEEENLKKLKTNMKTIEDISNAIYKAHTGSNKTKPQYKGPIIDEDEEETKQEMINRLNKELKRIDYLTKRQNTVFAILRNYEEAEFKKVLSINNEIDIKRFLDIWCPVRDGKKHKSIAIKEQNELYNINTKINRRESIQYGM